MKTSNAKCREYVQNKEPFKANNLHGQIEGGKYIVYSYGWYPLWAYVDGKWFENVDKYSSSTSKQKSQSCPLVETVKLSKEGMKDLVGNR